MKVFDENTKKLQRRIVYRKGMTVMIHPDKIPPKPELNNKPFTLPEYKNVFGIPPETNAQSDHLKYMNKYRKEKKKYDKNLKKWKKLKPGLQGKIIHTEKGFVKVKFNSGFMYSFSKINIDEFLFVCHKNLSEGMYIQTNLCKGVIKYKGPLQNHEEDGIYLGIELDEPNGKHDGRLLFGRRYFKTKKNHGIFILYDLLIHHDPKEQMKHQGTDISDEILHQEVQHAISILDDAVQKLDHEEQKELSFDLSEIDKKIQKKLTKKNPKKKTLKRGKFTSMIGNFL